MCGPKTTLNTIYELQATINKAQRPLVSKPIKQKIVEL
jgi:hypothetical protein